MNAHNRLFLIHKADGKFGLVLVCLALGGCALNTAPARAAAGDGSPIQAEMARIEKTPGKFPEFADFPKAPANVRPLKSWGVSAGQIADAAHQLERLTAPETWSLADTDRFLSQTLAMAAPKASGLAATTAETEAFVRDMRARATPPPPPKR